MHGPMNIKNLSWWFEAHQS